MAYCTIQDLRNEGLHVTDANAPRLQELIDEWSLWIERVTGWYFEERASQTLVLDGSGTRILHLPIPIISVTELRRVWRNTVTPQTFVVDATAYVAYARRHPTDDRYNPKIQLLGPMGDVLQDGARTWFTPGVQNYEVDGTFGFTDDDPQDPGTNITPKPIRRACIQLVLHHGGQLGDPDEFLARKNVDLRGLTVMGETLNYDGPLSSSTVSGVPEVDRILALYRAPMAVRAA